MPLSDDMISQVACNEFSDHNFSIIEEPTNEESRVKGISAKPSFSSSSSSSIGSSSTKSSSSQKLSSLLTFPPPSIPSTTSSFVSIFSSPSAIISSAILSTTTLLTFPLSMVFDEDQKVSEQESNDDDENLSLPICMISSPTPPLNRLPKFLQSSLAQAASSLPTTKTDIRSSLSSTSTLSSSSSPSLTSLLPNNLNISFASSKQLKISLTPPKDGFAQRKMMQGKKLSVAINPTMNRLMDGCHTVGVIGPSRDRHKRESILYKSDFIMKDMSPSIRSSLGSFNESGQEEVIITPYAQLLNSLRNIRNNYFMVANLSPMRSRRLSGYETQKNCKIPQLTDEMKQKLAMDTLEEIEFCLDKLENMQTHPSAGQIAAHKFRQILTREMSQNPDFKSGGAITGYLKTFLEENGVVDKRGNIDETPSGSISEVENGDLGNNKKTEEERISLSSFMTNITPELKEMINRTEDTWGVDLFELASLSNNRPLTYVAMNLFQKNNLLRNLRINETTFFRYICLVEDNYHAENSYHNNIHATDVLQATYFMLTFSAFKDIFSELEIFAVMFSAAVHDVDHPGVTNHFLINTGSELAILYNDESVLENHHATFAFQLLTRQGCDFISSFSKKQKQTFRKLTISIILATDMSKHLQHVANLKTMVEVKRLSSSSSSSTSNISALLSTKIFDEDNYEDRMQILQSVVHCSDLSNPLKPLEVYLKWTDRIMEEFFKQGDREKDLHLDVSPLCNRDNSDICKSQIGFIDYVVHPLWEIWAALTNPDCQIILDNLENNRVWLSTQDALANIRNKVHCSTTDNDDDDDKNENDFI